MTIYYKNLSDIPTSKVKFGDKRLSTNVMYSHLAFDGTGGFYLTDDHQLHIYAHDLMPDLNCKDVKYEDFAFAFRTSGNQPYNISTDGRHLIIKVDGELKIDFHKFAEMLSNI